MSAILAILAVIWYVIGMIRADGLNVELAVTFLLLMAIVNAIWELTRAIKEAL